MEWKINRKQREKTELQCFYKKRIEELDDRIEELRRLMAEKETSFSKVLERLAKYEELKEMKLEDKIDDLEFNIDERFAERIKSKLSQENGKLAL